jgi:hypothetical protein
MRMGIIYIYSIKRGILVIYFGEYFTITRVDMHGEGTMKSMKPKGAHHPLRGCCLEPRHKRRNIHLYPQKRNSCLKIPSSSHTP